MDFNLEHAIDVLRRTPAVLNAWLDGLAEPWVFNHYGPQTFNPFDVVGHLIHGEEADWMPRLHLILTHREAVPFEPFDRYAMYEASKGKTMAMLLTEFESLRRRNLDELQALRLSLEQLDWRGTHPALGPVTIRQLLSTWVVHDLNHLHQIAKCMAYQYREAIGPWRAYVGVLASVE